MKRTRGLSTQSREFLDKLVAVHMTNYYPEDGKIRTHANATKGTQDYRPRHTVHTSLNHPVGSHGANSWEGVNFAIVAPLTDILDDERNTILNLCGVDTYFLDDLHLPKSAVLISNDRSLPVKRADLPHQKTNKPVYVAAKEFIENSRYPYIEGGANYWLGNTVLDLPSGKRFCYARDLSNLLGDVASELDVPAGLHHGTPYEFLEKDISLIQGGLRAFRESVEEAYFLEKLGCMERHLNSITGKGKDSFKSYGHPQIVTQTMHDEALSALQTIADYRTEERENYVGEEKVEFAIA